MIKAVITSDSLHPFHDLSQAFIYFFLFSDQIPQQTREQNTNLMQAVHSVTPQGTTALLCNIPVVTISWQRLCQDRRKIPMKFNESNHKKMCL